MSIKEPMTGFSPAGAVAWPLDQWPCWRGGRNGWWHEAAVWDFDPLTGRAMVNGQAADPAALVVCNRASNHLLADAAGVYRSFGSHEPAMLAGVGLYVGGVATNLLPYSHAFNSWSPLNAVLVSDNAATAPDGAMAAAHVQQTAATHYHGVLSGSSFTTVAGQSYVHDFYVRKGDHRYVQLFVGGPVFGPNAYGNFDTQEGVWGTVGADLVASAIDLGAYWWLRGKSTAISTGSNPTVGVMLVSGLAATRAESWAGSASRAIHLWGAGVLASKFPVPHIPTVTAAAGIAASDVAASDVDWFSSHGLGAACTQQVNVSWQHIDDGAERVLFSYAKDASNFIRGYVNASGYPALKIVTGGVVQTDMALTSAIGAGKGALIFGWSAEGGYVGDHLGNGASFGAVTLPTGITSKRLGSSQSGRYLNDVIERMTAYRLRTQAQAMALVSAA